MATNQAAYFNEHAYIAEAQALNAKHENREAFHRAMEPLLVKMASDKEFMLQVIERNFTDKGWLNHDWSDYNIPFFYVYENDDMIIKVHIFPAGPAGKQHYAAHAIHHHNNYLLTTYAFFGSGYESLLFEKDPKVDADSLETRLKVNKHFHQQDWNPSRVDSWEPHLVFLPESLSATFLMWSPDVKRKTDRLRNHRLLKPFKKELRHLIYKLGAGDRLGIARKETFQFFVQEGKTMGISEEKYFAPSKAANGATEKQYAMQMLFSFIQQANLVNEKALKMALSDVDCPAYYKPFISQVLAGEEVPEVYHRYELNIPNKSYTREEVLDACS
jgi:hypothetical protein